MNCQLQSAYIAFRLSLSSAGLRGCCGGASQRAVDESHSEVKLYFHSFVCLLVQLFFKQWFQSTNEHDHTSAQSCRKVLQC